MVWTSWFWLDFVLLLEWFNFLGMDEWIPLVLFLFLVAMLSFVTGYLFILRASWRRNLELACKLSPCMSSLLWVDNSQLELTLFLCYFPWIANYQIVMVSFINSNTCRSICCWLCWLLIFVYACSNLGWRIYWSLLWVIWFRHFLIIGRVLFFFVLWVFWQFFMD